MSCFWGIEFYRLINTIGTVLSTFDTKKENGTTFNDVPITITKSACFIIPNALLNYAGND